MALEVENNGDFTEAVGFDMTLSKEEFISAMSLAVDGTPWTSRFVQRSHKEIMSQETLDISKSAVRLNLTPRYKHGTLYQMAVKVPPKKTVKYVVKSLRLLERQERKYRYEVQVSFEHQVEMFSAETTFLQSVNFFLDPLKSFTAEEITDITNEGNLSEGELKKITVKWKLNKNSINEGKTLRWAVGYTRKTTRSPGFCAMGEDGYFVHFVNVKNRYKVRTSIIIVLDKSASMYPEKIKKVKSAMTKMIEKKVLRGKYNILTYGNDVAKLWTRMRNIDNLRHTAMAKNFIRSMQANGMANINQALMDALTLLKKGDTKRSLRMIIFLTDGSASGGHQLRTDEIVRNFTTHNTLHCPVFGLAYGENADLHFLKSLAARSSGFVRFIEETDQAEQQIEDSVREIISVVIKDMEVEYKPPLRGSVTKTYHPYILNGSEHLICGHYSGSKLSFTYRISGLHHTTGKIKTWRSRPFKCHVHRDLNGIAKLMLNYQELQEKISGKQGLEFQYLAQSLCQTSRSIFTFVTPCSTISFKTDQKNHETVKLEQLDLDLMIPVDFTFLNPYYPMNESQFPARYLKPKTTTTKEPKTTTTKEPKTTTTKEPKIITTKEPKTTTTKEPKTKPQKDLRTTKTNRPQIVREGILKVMTIEFPTKSPLFKAGNGICIISKKWYSREYKLLQDEHSGLQIIHAYCYRYKLCGKSSILMHYEGKTLRVNLTRKTRWSISTEPSGETFGLREESKNRTHLKFVKPGEIIVKLSKYRATEKGKSYDHFKLHVKFLSSVPSNKKRLSGMLGIYLTRIRDAVRETDKLCKDFSFTFYVKRKTIEEFVIRRLL